MIPDTKHFPSFLSQLKTEIKELERAFPHQSLTYDQDFTEEFICDLLRLIKIYEIKWTQHVRRGVSDE